MPKSYLIVGSVYACTLGQRICTLGHFSRAGMRGTLAQRGSWVHGLYKTSCIKARAATPSRNEAKGDGRERLSGLLALACVATSSAAVPGFVLEALYRVPPQTRPVN
jgi:hypothetical protein